MRVYRREKTRWQKSPFVISIVGSFKYARPRREADSKKTDDHETSTTSVLRQKDEAEGRKGGLDKKWARGSRLSAPSPRASSSAGVFRSCWNAILRIPGRDGKSTVEQFVTTARCRRRRRDLKVDTYRVRVRRARGYGRGISLYACVYTNEIHGGGGIRQKGIGFH